VTERHALRRAELALAALGVTAAMLVCSVAVDFVHFHGLTPDLHVALGLIAAAVIVRAGVSLARQLRAQRAFLRRLPVVREAVVHGHAVRVVPGHGLQAFCAGLLRPAVYVSEGTLAASEPVVRAVLAHEEHHRARRDPLRLLCARTVADALRPLPPFAALAEREAALADLAADAASVEALGNRAPLASALARFGDVAPERVDRLVGATRAVAIPSALLIAAAAIVAGIAFLVATMLLADWHPHEAALLIAALPACVAARRAAAALRPVA
jgi:bla regulator protein blaR1